MPAIALTSCFAQQFFGQMIEPPPDPGRLCVLQSPADNHGDREADHDDMTRQRDGDCLPAYVQWVPND
jgi:hypothetical protein